jgi:phosphatidylserine/phosphatidylglycerophosphate/cardiolipin synthase-like enzyme
MTVQFLEAPPAGDWPRAAVQPITGLSRIETFVSPDCSYAALRDLIGSAEQEILLYIYNASAAHMLDLLRAAAGRGVEVTVMYDRTDTRSQEEAKLRDLGVTLHLAPSVAPRRAFTVCHQKFMVIDRKIVVLGSANWATTSVPKIEDPLTGPWKKGNREWLIAIRNRKAATRFAALFRTDRDWTPSQELVAFEAPQPLPAAFATLEEAPPLRRMQRELFEVGSEITPLLSPQNYFEVVSGIVRRARRSILIEQQYIKTSGDGDFVEDLLELVRDRYRNHDVEVRIVSSCAFPQGWHDTARTLSTFGLRRRLRALNPSSFTHCHNKGVVVDGKHVVVSSTNWSDNSIGSAREAGVLISDAAVARYYTDAFDIDWQEGMTAAETDAFLRREAVLPAPREALQIHPADLR